jgi:hypothetical protein
VSKAPGSTMLMRILGTSGLSTSAQRLFDDLEASPQHPTAIKSARTAALRPAPDNQNSRYDMFLPLTLNPPIGTTLAKNRSGAATMPP